MEGILLQQAVEMTSYILHTYYCKQDAQEAVKYFAEDITWIGSGKNEYYHSKKSIKEYFEKNLKMIPNCEVFAENYEIVDCGDTCLVYGYFTVHSTEESKFIVEVTQRISFLYQNINTQLSVKHFHISNPFEEINTNESFPKQIGAQSYQYLQRLLKEKTDVIDMITSNINGGIKSINDDPIYSHSYVNPGLPKMLGYTYDEFMKISNNCVIGAVYPDDVAKTLQSILSQLDSSMMYSVEYRMKKKDGSLIWVLDSGSKSEDAKGSYKINSILMDITPLKTALTELELERSRYRIALENITDVMYEYDIEQDIYTTYQRIEVGGKTELEKYEMTDFSKSFWAKSLVHPSDTDKFIEVLRAEQREMIEIRTKSVQAKGKWRWTQVSCSVIYNTNRKPIRTIGTMKDITDEKKNKEKLMNYTYQDPLTKLLNQMTTKQYIQQYLIHKDIHMQSALMVIDLDDFKKINDTTGNFFGNAVLIATSTVLKENIRTEDIVGRISGDEFIIFLKRANYTAAALCAKRIIEKVSAIGQNENTAISCSIGIALSSPENSNYDTLLHMADRALYFAKAKGKKQFVLYEDTLGQTLDINEL